MINIKAALDITKTMLCTVIDYGNILLSSCNQSWVPCQLWALHHKKCVKYM